ncbi:eukaryotic translation initiation factor 4B2-like isoform X2 [Bidens hawaiensis]|uniref:eukaryotic translation initiation factor 4B2-like isoform X2 n=1 Tax=Bidens hawaiensis TaxID=980011 RepID=UPI00404935F1
MSKVWGNIGAWAEDSERAEAEEKEQAAAAAAAQPQSFPSLREAVTTGKGKKKTKMTLQEFTLTRTGSGTGSGGFRLTPDELMNLPTGPKEQTVDEMQYGRTGGGFSAYGGGRTGGGPRMRDREPVGDGAWGNNNNRRSYGGFDGSVIRNAEYDQPSRADEVDNWLMVKKTQSVDIGTRPNRYSSLGSTGGVSRADGIDNWTINKKPVTLVPVRSPSFGSGGIKQFDKFEQFEQQRRRLVLEPRKHEPAVAETVTAVMDANKPNPFGNARPREEILAEKGLDWRKSEIEYEAKRISRRPTSSHSNSRPGSAQSGSSAEVSGAFKPRAKVNPFGDAKPREVLLQEKGVDYRKIDLELERRRLGRPETEAEKSLKEEIYNLQRENQTGLHDTILEKERDLEQLTRDLDDKLRFAQKTVERPSSGAGRVGPGFQERLGSGSGRAGSGFHERPGSGSGRTVSGFYERPGSGSGIMGPGFYERPPSQSGSFDGSRSVEFSDRPRFRGFFGMRGGDDRRGFVGGKDNRGFLGNRELGRSNSRDRW